MDHKWLDPMQIDVATLDPQVLPRHLQGHSKLEGSTTARTTLDPITLVDEPTPVVAPMVTQEVRSCQEDRQVRALSSPP
jgi:hypothetical protein